jgi:PAS domain S-box-containing protein
MTFRLPIPLAQAIEVRARTTGRDKTTVVTEALAQVFGLPELSPAPATLDMLQEQVEQLEDSISTLSEQVVHLPDRVTTLEQLVASVQNLLESFEWLADDPTGIAAASLGLCGNCAGETEETLQLIARLQKQVGTQAQILLTLPDPLFVYDRLGRFTYVNPVGARLLKHSPTSLLGQAIESLNLPLTLKEQLVAQLTTVLTTGRTISREVSIPTATAETRDYECIVSPIQTIPIQPSDSPIAKSQDEIDRMNAVVWIARDITDRKHAEMVLRESEQNYRNLFESANDSIFVIDFATHQILNANVNAARRLGYTRQELLQLTLDAIDAPTSPAKRETLLQALRLQGSLTVEHIYRHKDGTDIPIEFSSRMIEYGDRLAIQSAVRDISERKQIEQTLRNSEARFRRIFENLPLGMALINCRTQQVAQVNAVMCQRFGYTATEFCALSIEQLSHPEDASSIVQYLQRVQAGDSGGQIEKRGLTKRQETVWICLGATAFDDPDDTVFVGMTIGNSNLG